MRSSITKLQERDTCLALTFLLLIVWLFMRDDVYIFAAIALLLYGMVWSTGMRPLAHIWFTLSMLLGKIMSKILLSIVYLLLVLPVGLVRRMLNKDTLRLKNFGVSQKSCFVTRNHTYTANDIVNPY